MLRVLSVWLLILSVACCANACSASDAEPGDGSGAEDAVTAPGSDTQGADGGATSVDDAASVPVSDTASLPGVDTASGPSADTAVTPSDDTTATDAVSETPVDDPFSFFVTSIEAMQELSGSLDGFGGNLGGLAGADEICQTVAATVDGGGKVWRAFLSTTSALDDNGQPTGVPVHAIDRIGDGPWYDRNGRLVAMNKEDLITERPTGADPQIAEDLPNEFGQGQQQFGDNHDTLTGTNASGMLNSTDPLGTCMDWRCPDAGNPDCPDPTAFEKTVMGGHSWPRDDTSGPGGGGPGGGQLATQAAAACVGLSPGDVCTAQLNQGQVESLCVTDDATGELACNVPVPPPWFFACSDAEEGATCVIDKGPQKFDGTCAALEGVTSLACVPEDFDPSATGDSSGQDPSNWMAAHTVPGCNPGIQLEQVGGGQGTLTVGGGGGYGGIYCFALTP